MSINSERGKHAESIIKNHVIFSLGAGVIPFPIADIFAVTAIQLDMIRQLCKVYDINFAETKGKAIVSALTTSSLARLGGGSLAKMIPVVGSYLGGVTNAALAGASTYALGQVFKIHFETGGTILDFDADRLKKMYKEQFEKGKKVAEELRKQQEAKRKAASEEVEVQDVEIEDVMAEAVQSEAKEPAEPAQPNTTDATIERLKQLAELKESGIITDFEFERMKKRVLKGE